MKYLLALLLFSFQVSANDEKVCEYLSSETFETYSKSAQDSDDLENTRLNKAIKEVSTKLNHVRDSQCKGAKLIAIYDFDTCSSMCIEATTSERRAKAASSGFVILGKEARRCQQLCKGYQLAAYSFKAGVKVGAESANCDGVVNTTSRSSSNKEATSTHENIKSVGKKVLSK